MKYLGSKKLVTDRLELRTQTMEEQQQLCALLHIPEICKYYLTTCRKDRVRTQPWELQKEICEDKISHANDNNVFDWSIFLKENDEFIGEIKCKDISKERDKIFNIDFIIAPEHQGKGYATEAIQRVIDFMFDECEIDYIEACVAINDTITQKILCKLGFEIGKEIQKKYYKSIKGPVEAYTYTYSKGYLKKKFNNKFRVYEISRNGIEKPFTISGEIALLKYIKTRFETSDDITLGFSAIERIDDSDCSFKSFHNNSRDLEYIKGRLEELQNSKNPVRVRRQPSQNDIK